MNLDPFVKTLLPDYSQVHLKSEEGQLHLILPKTPKLNEESQWAQIYQDLKTCLHQSELSWEAGQIIHLIAQDCLLDSRQLQNLAEILEAAHLKLQWIHTRRRQTAVAAAAAGYNVEQQTDLPPLKEPSSSSSSLLDAPLYIKSTIRSGGNIRHPGTVIVVGDVNPGGEVVADGDIIIWGTLRGVAHAGAKGNEHCSIMALRMEPTQLRIADYVARAPSSNPDDWQPEIAYLSSDGIRLTPAYNFWKTHDFDQERKYWIEKG